MKVFLLRPAAAVLALALLPAAAMAQRVSVRFEDGARPFPTNRLTVVDTAQATGVRVNLPLPDCGVQVTDCQDIAVINQLDGFSTQPRISVPFTGEIDLDTVNSRSIFLVNLGDTQSSQGAGERVGINQTVWDPDTQTLFFEPDQLLAEHARYVLIVTNSVRDTRGKKLKAANFYESRGRKPKGKPYGLEPYPRELRGAVSSVRRHLRGQNVVAASLFTTQSSTGDLMRIKSQIKASQPSPADFMIGSSGGGAVRAVFDVAGLSAIQYNRQTGAAPAFTPLALPVAALQVVPGSVAQVAYGRYSSPNYLSADQTMPVTPSLNGQPAAQGSRDLVFQLFVPGGARPAGGWPVAIFGHGFTDSMYGAPWTLASVMASRGVATLSINVVGHGGGAAGTLDVSAGGGTVTVPAGGRGFDQNGDGAIDSTEGVSAVGARAIIGNRDGLRQTVTDLMQLVRQVEVGMDVDGDGSADLDARRIYYAGQSFGGIYGTMLMGVEPAIRAGVPNVPGGSITEVARLGAFRALTGLSLALRQPPLLNLAPTATLPVPLNFNENIPLRDQPPLVNDVPGALAIADVLDRTEWVQQSGNPVSYASMIRRQPPAGHAPKAVILQMAKGDITVPNPTTTAIVRAGGLADRTTYYRHDLAYANDTTLPRNPHTFLTNIALLPAIPYAIGAQMQMAVFFASDGTLTFDPDAGGPFFEVPLSGALPEGLNFLP
ncbi:MAG: hypothetical protein R3E94_04440 [Burkholderiaceae bacterium]